jgi:hypothetical protein
MVRGGDGEKERWGEGERGRWGEGEMRRWGEGEKGRRGDGEKGSDLSKDPARSTFNFQFSTFNVFHNDK